MIKPSEAYAVITGNNLVIMRGSKSRCWSECKRRRATGDVTAYVMLTSKPVGSSVEAI